MDNNPLKSFLKIPYDVLEEMNLTANIKRDTVSHAELEKEYKKKLEKEQQIIAYAAPEIEGFLLDGVDAEQNFNEKIGFKLISMGGYYHSLPLDRLRLFIDAAAEAQRAMGFMNEKD